MLFRSKHPYDTIEWRERGNLGEGDIDLYHSNTDFHILQLLSSTMSKREYIVAHKKLLLIGKLYHYSYSGIIPGELQTSGTPLNQAIAFANAYSGLYKSAHKLDILNTIFLTDGHADETEYVRHNGYTQDIYHANDTAWANRYKCNIIVRDKKTGNNTGIAPYPPSARVPVFPYG